MARTRKDTTTPPPDKSRRGKGEGSVYQRKDGRWVAEVQLGYDAEGKRRSKLLYGPTRKAVVDKIKDLQLDIRQNDGVLLEPSKLTLGEYLTQWLEQIRPTRRVNSWRNYEQAIRLHVTPEIGQVPLAKLTGLHVQRLYTAKSTEGYAANTIKLIHAAVFMALKQAVAWGLLPRNVAETVDTPRVPREEIRCLTPEQVQQLLASLTGSRDRALLSTAVLTGLRLGELTGLTWANVDLAGRTLTVMQTLHCHKGPVYEMGEPKTAHSRRTMPLPTSLVSILKAHRKQQAEEQLAASGAWKDRFGLVFTRADDGEPYSPKAAHHALKKCLALAGLPPIRMHGLRHTYATLLLTQGTHIKVASALLGHANVGITLDLYSHLVPGLTTEAAERLDNLFAAAINENPRR